MTTHSPNFETSEYKARIARTRAAMAGRGLDLLVVSDPSNMAWLTGYDGWSFYVHQAVILPLEDAPVWWGRGMDAAGAARTVFMAGTDSIRSYADRYVQNPDQHPMEDLARVIADLGGRRIGVELDNYYYSAKAHDVLSGRVEAYLEDATGLVNWQRIVKSPREIAYIRQAARIVEQMHRAMLEQAEPGMPKHHLIAEIYRTGIRGVEGAWGDYPAIVPMAPSGMDATAPHLTWDDQPLRAGEPTFFELAGVHRRYHAPQSRTLFFGEPPAQYRRAEEAVLEATRAAMEVLRPGKLCEDVAAAFNGTLARFGFSKDSRCGYPIGLSYPPDWGERTASFRAGDTTVIAAGMVFHFMPALWLDDGGIEITEPVLVTEKGAEFLTGTPRGLFVK
ncbi:ectoine hydrolase [Rubricella aquisinus]|uniref:Ectoine hydrolase n=1 Tax=Rubricella aquisinus TaxID=2028108 RepID=A0A840X0F8_9RHOB|nr:M24 family metallopeptidase [Rubricella aquisinus]MBB5514147.1 ectoine hydrolase [Rubricella aquisinus]